jgi:hypothetical protein
MDAIPWRSSTWPGIVVIAVSERLYRVRFSASYPDPAPPAKTILAYMARSVLPATGSRLTS